MKYATETVHPGLIHDGHVRSGPGGYSTRWVYIRYLDEYSERWVITRHPSTDKAAANRWAWWGAIESIQAIGCDKWDEVPSWQKPDGIYGRTLDAVIAQIEGRE